MFIKLFSFFSKIEEESAQRGITPPDRSSSRKSSRTPLCRFNMVVASVPSLFTPMFLTSKGQTRRPPLMNMLLKRILSKKIKMLHKPICYYKLKNRVSVIQNKVNSIYKTLDNHSVIIMGMAKAYGIKKTYLPVGKTPT